MTCAYNDPSSRPRDVSEGRPAAERCTRALPAAEVERIRTLAFSFDALDHLLRVCRRLYERSYDGQSAAYHGDEGRYYLLLSDRSGSRYASPHERIPFSFINEYGTQQNAQAIRLYIREHARAICEQNAIARLSAL